MFQGLTVEYGVPQAIFEGDSEIVTKALNNTEVCMAQYGQAIEDGKMDSKKASMVLLQSYLKTRQHCCPCIGL